jgi:phage major head subunit gpT-like protein
VEKIQPAKIVGNPFKPEATFRDVMDYLLGTEKLIEPLYQLDKAGKLTPENASSAEGRAFLDAQLVRGGQMLGNLWFSAWQQATEDKFLIRALKERQAAKVGSN